MTGYGRGSATLGAANLVVELRAVNHRFLDVRVRLPGGLAEHGSAVEEVVRKQATRGRVDVTARIEGGALGTPTLDRDRARAAYNALIELRDELDPKGEVPLSVLGALPDLFVDSGQQAAADVGAALRKATGGACKALSEMREAEGQALATDFESRLDRIEELTAEIRPRSQEVVEHYRQKLTDRIGKLLNNSSTDLDAGRLEHEVVVFADRADIEEELTRLASHCAQFRKLVGDKKPAEGVGRRLEFLLQEMGREVNTTGAKLPDVQVTPAVIDLKAELERMREQVQNVL